MVALHTVASCGEVGGKALLASPQTVVSCGEVSGKPMWLFQIPLHHVVSGKGKWHLQKLIHLVTRDLASHLESHVVISHPDTPYTEICNMIRFCPC